MTWVDNLLGVSGGIAGLYIIISSGYHNLRMREYARRQALALEKLTGEGDEL